MVRAQPAQALFNLVDDRVPAEIAVDRLAIPIEEVIALLRVPDETALLRRPAIALPTIASDFPRP